VSARLLGGLGTGLLRSEHLGRRLGSNPGDFQSLQTGVDRTQCGLVEVRMLDVEDFGVNPQAPEFGRLGVLYVSHGKAMKGSAPKQRSVLSVFGWASECLEEWMTEIRLALARGRGQMLWPTERGGRVGETRIEDHFASIRRELGLPAVLTFHSLRRSFVTHLIEDGFDARFVQEQQHCPVDIVPVQ